MDFSISEELLEIKRTVRDFAEKEIRPHVMEWDEKQIFPYDVLKQLAGLGFLGVLVPTEYGGAGLGYTEYVTVAALETDAMSSKFLLVREVLAEVARTGRPEITRRADVEAEFGSVEAFLLALHHRWRTGRNVNRFAVAQLRLGREHAAVSGEPKPGR